MKKRPNKERFEEKIDKTKTCWLWTGYIGTSGYGEFCYNGKSERSHRVSYLIYNGEIPDGLIILHSCDNRICVNPEHLSVGTMQDNIRDRQDRGRQSKGEKQYFSKLTEKQVLEIRAKYVPIKYSTCKLASEYSVNSATIYRIITRETWKHI